MLNGMSATSPTIAPQGGTYDLSGVGLTAGGERTSSRAGLLAIAGVLVSGVTIAVAAAHTTTLLPQSVEYASAADLAGAFNGLGLNLHAGGTIAALTLLFISYVFVVRTSDRLS